MTPELTALTLAVLLQAAQLALAGAAANRDAGAAWNAGPRDRQPEFSPLTGRLKRAAANHFEGLAFFTAAVVVVTLSGKTSGFTAACGWIYLAARALFVPAYAFGWTPGRSLIWAAGFAATMAMLLAALF
ncbi:MAG: MAPEG family protein [Gemmobacter sp.]